MSSEVVKFVGGPIHGQWLELKTPLSPEFKVPLLERGWRHLIELPSEPLPVKVAVYELQECSGGAHDGAHVYYCTLDPT